MSSDLFDVRVKTVKEREVVWEDVLQRHEQETVEESWGSLDNDREHEWKPRRWETCHN